MLLYLLLSSYFLDFLGKPNNETSFVILTGIKKVVHSYNI